MTDVDTVAHTKRFEKENVGIFSRNAMPGMQTVDAKRFTEGLREVKRHANGSVTDANGAFSMWLARAEFVPKH